LVVATASSAYLGDFRRTEMAGSVSIMHANSPPFDWLMLGMSEVGPAETNLRRANRSLSICGWTDHERISQQCSGTGTVAEQNPQRDARQRTAVRQPIERDSFARFLRDAVVAGTSMLSC
jgi:hypothetical protein